MLIWGKHYLKNFAFVLSPTHLADSSYCLCITLINDYVMVNKTAAISVSWRLHFKGRQAVNKPLVVPKELKWTVDWGGFSSVGQRQLCWKCVVSEMAGAEPCAALKEKQKLHWQEEKNDWVFKEQSVNVAGVCPRYCRADMKISLQNRKWGVKQMARR